MTKLPAAVESNAIHEKLFEDENEENEEKHFDLKTQVMKTPCKRGLIQPAANAYNHDDENEHYNEPLGYQNFLYDVNIEYSPGGNRSTDSLGSKHCFKMKCLPYMVENPHKSELLTAGVSSLSIDNGEGTIDMIDCDRGSGMFINSQHDAYEIDDEEEELSSRLTSTNRTITPTIDVTRETCAFLSNSDFVPSVHRRIKRRVVLELVSAKLSQSNGYSIPPNSSYNNLITLTEDSAIPTMTSNNTLNFDSSSLRSYHSHSSSTGASSNNNNTDLSRSQVHFSSPARSMAPSAALPPAPSSPSSSKKFVNYTILIKTIPGLDKHPAVIERRFSDFLNLYQGLRSNETNVEIVDSNVSFPKKVYMGNFSLEKIAERSIEFTRLLHLCISEPSLMWSVHFISFLIDKELKEAHRLSLFGDPDDVQALIENAYYIEQKLYMRIESSSKCSSSTSSLASNNNQQQSAHPSPTLPKMRLSTTPDLTRGRNSKISADHLNGSSSSSNSNPINAQNQSQQRPTSSEPSENGSDRIGNDSTLETSDQSNFSIYDKSVLSPINQRILVTFCMLFITYCRSNNYRELKRVVRKFSQLISSQEYVDSLLNTRHYNSLRACLLFLMNMTQGNVIDDGLRLQLKRRLEDIDGANADYQHRSAHVQHSPDANGWTRTRPRLLTSRDDDSLDKRATTRITKNDLTSLLRDRNFCLFQDGRI